MSFLEKIKAYARELSPNCREASRAQSEMLDRPVTVTTRLGVWLHLFICKWCRRYGQQIRFLRNSAQTHSDKFTEADPGQLSTSARDRIKEKIRGIN